MSKLHQRGLFDHDPTPAHAQHGRAAAAPAPASIRAIDPSVLDDDRPRLSRQCVEILERLKSGPATNGALSRCALKYTGRISDLRAAGYDIRIIDRFPGGIVMYALFTDGTQHGGY